MALTDTALKALKPKQKTYVVSDSRGLYAEGALDRWSHLALPLSAPRPAGKADAREVP